MSRVAINADQSPMLVIELIYKLKVKDAMSSALVTICADARMRDALRRALRMRRVFA